MALTRPTAFPRFTRDRQSGCRLRHITPANQGD